MKTDYDLICIGLGPAGMAVSAMGAAMGLKVCGIEKNKIGGECMNVGCIPSKSLLKLAELNHAAARLSEIGLLKSGSIEMEPPFARIAAYLDYISNKKTIKMFDQVHLVLKEGAAEFVDPHTVRVGGRTISARRIFIATGTEPMVPPIEGIDGVDFLTNLNVFDLKEIPAGMIIIGGGAIGCELAQAFARLGTKCTIVEMADRLLPNGDPEAGKLLEQALTKEGIVVHLSTKVASARPENGGVTLVTGAGDSIHADRLLLAAGRKIVLEGLNLDKAGVKTNGRAILVDGKYRTSAKHIYAVGDCNGGVMFSHAAMHQGMIALMNAVSPWSLFSYKRHVIPWTVFTEPQVSFVGMRQEELERKGVRYRTHVARYEDYGAAIAEHVGVGFVKVFASPLGRVYGVSIVGEGSGEMINEWALIVQKKIRLHSVLFLAHSFPTMGFLSKRVAEMWMMQKMQSSFLRKMMCFFYRRL
ncbi:MAG: NAD(P)/FAD-dependent oxidoreductase [Acidobacteriota bacterium]|nr:NAD(P)/FAD-dependent oxidoreductase [Acidobacteriota bacterium]